MLKYSYTIFILLLLSVTNSQAGKSPEHNADPHYSPIGFFDIHICNWPSRTNFLKILFSSEKYNQIDSMKVFTPAGKLLVQLDNKKFSILKRKNKPDKRVFMLDIDVPENALDGWYNIKVKTKNGKQYQAKDYVILNKIGRVTAMQPASEEKKYSLPITLKWKPVSGALYYVVYLKDGWTGKLVYKSKPLKNHKTKIPKGKLEPGGYYKWFVHARDTNEHVLLGDFNMGSISKKVTFMTAE